MFGDGLLKTVSRLKSWLRINSAIRRCDCRICLLNVQLWPWCDAFTDSKEEEGGEGGIFVAPYTNTPSTHTFTHSSVKTIFTNDSLWVSTGHSGHFKSTPNCTPATAALSEWVCACSVSIGSVKCRHVVWRNVFLINHKGAFKPMCSAVGNSPFPIPSENTWSTQRLTANGSVVNHITRCRADSLFGPSCGSLVLIWRDDSQDKHKTHIQMSTHTSLFNWIHGNLLLP